jgi:hypothetical protein
MQFKEKFIAFIDILGFKQLVECSERGEGIPLEKIVELVEKLGRAGKRQFFQQYGPEMCPTAAFLQRDLDFRATQISDCVVMSAEISPAGGINLISQSWSAVAHLLTDGLLCRGYITRGFIYHTDTQFIGTGYQKAVEKEKSVLAFSRHTNDLGTPFVEVDAQVRDYLTSSPDGCVREMFSRLVKDDGTLTAIFPFKSFSAKFAISPSFDAAAQRKSNQNLRTSLRTMKENMMKYVDQSNRKAVTKSEHYLAALDEQLEICDRTDKVIDALADSFPRSKS